MNKKLNLKGVFILKPLEVLNKRSLPRPKFELKSFRIKRTFKFILNVEKKIIYKKKKLVWNEIYVLYKTAFYCDEHKYQGHLYYKVYLAGNPDIYKNKRCENSDTFSKYQIM